MIFEASIRNWMCEEDPFSENLVTNMTPELDHTTSVLYMLVNGAGKTE